MKLFYYSVLIIFCCSSTSHALQNKDLQVSEGFPIGLDFKSAAVDFSKYMSSTHDIPDSIILKGCLDDYFRDHKAYHFKYPYSDSVWWIKIPILNTTKEEMEMVIGSFENVHTFGKAFLYLRNNSKSRLIYNQEYNPKNDLIYRFNGSLTKFLLPASSLSYLYVKTSSVRSALYFDLRLFSKSKYQQEALSSIIIKCFYLGIIFICSVLIFLVYLKVRSKALVAYLFLTLLWSASFIKGFFIGPTLLIDGLNFYFAQLNITFLIAFLYFFMKQLGTFKLQHLFLSIFWISVIALLSYVLNDYGQFYFSPFLYIFRNFLYFVYVLVIIITIISNYKSNKNARIAAISFFPIILFGVIIALRNTGIIPCFEFSRTFTIISIIWVLFVFTIYYINEFKSKLFEQDSHLVYLQNERMREQQKSLNYETQLRKSINFDLHDELGSSLSALCVGLKTVLIKYEDNGEIARNILQQSFTITKELSSRLKDLLWVNDPKNDSVISFFEQVRQIVFELNKVTGRSITISAFNSRTPEEKMGPIVRKMLLLIAREALNNAIKYTDNVPIEVVLNRTDEYLVFKVIDYGQGIHSQVQNEKYGLQSLKFRADKIKADFKLNSCIQGTEIIVTLHQNDMNLSYSFN